MSDLQHIEYLKGRIDQLEQPIANNRRDSEVLFSSVWTIRE